MRRGEQMAKQFKDFSFCGQKLSDLSTKYISVDFDNDSDINLAMERDMEMGETNRYRNEANYFYDTWTNVLEFDLHIMKDVCTYANQKDLEISKEEIRDITKWLSSPHLPEWIKFTYDDTNNDVTDYFGWFSNIETFVSGGKVYGLKLHYKCTTSFGYTDEITKTETVTSYKNILISNNSDCLNDYLYPKITITPNSNGQIFFCNLNDMEVLQSGTLTQSSKSYFESLLDTLESYAKSKGYTVRYTGTGANNIESLCDNTAVQFYLVDSYNNETKCTAYYKNDSTKQYQIITGGFMYMSIYRDLDVFIDTEKLIINDSLGRMITYDKLGIKDVDQMYWFRLLPGNNSILLYGNCAFEFKYREPRKVGE